MDRTYRWHRFTPERKQAWVREQLQADAYRAARAERIAALRQRLHVGAAVMGKHGNVGLVISFATSMVLVKALTHDYKISIADAVLLVPDPAWPPPITKAQFTMEPPVSDEDIAAIVAELDAEE